MRCKSITTFLWVFLLTIFLIGCNDSPAEKTESDTTNEAVENQENEEDTEETTNNDVSEEESVETVMECSEIEDTIARGDCYESILAEERNWWGIIESQEVFYYPTWDPSLSWDHIFYYDIDDSDQLSEMVKTVYYETYIENSSEREIKKGAKIITSLWEEFSKIVPKEYREQVKRIAWTDTGEVHLYGATRIDGNEEDHMFVLSHNTLGYEDRLIGIFIHEFAHVLTTNEDQIAFAEDINEDDCPTVYQDGCYKESSYIYDFYQRFWEDIAPDHEAVDWESEESYKEFFFKYEDRFFNTYQGTNVREDIAEAFSLFIMSNSEDIMNQTELKYEKVKFFYEYDELVELRTIMLENLSELPIVNLPLFP